MSSFEIPASAEVNMTKPEDDQLAVLPAESKPDSVPQTVKGAKLVKTVYGEMPLEDYNRMHSGQW